MFTKTPNRTNLFSTAAVADAIVNTVNCVGIMGAGVAKSTSEKYPEILLPYRVACGISPETYIHHHFKVLPDIPSGYKELWRTRNDLVLLGSSGPVSRLVPGAIHIHELKQTGPSYIVNFASKDDWKNPSKMEWIENGFLALRYWAEYAGIKTIATPPPGGGLGGLDPLDISEMARTIFKNSSVELLWHGPTRTLSQSISTISIAQDSEYSFPRAYAIIGSSKTGTGDCLTLENYSRKFSSLGMWFFSGGAYGADSAGERGANPKKKIIFYANRNRKYGNQYIPIPRIDAYNILLSSGELKDEAVHIVSSILDKSHWENIKRKGDFVANLHIRNAFQVLGPNLRSPVEFIVCWGLPDSDGTVQGGTKTAIRLARLLNIPWYNIAIPEHLTKLEAFLSAGTQPRSKEELEKTFQAMAKLGIKRDKHHPYPLFESDRKNMEKSKTIEVAVGNLHKLTPAERSQAVYCGRWKSDKTYIPSERSEERLRNTFTIPPHTHGEAIRLYTELTLKHLKEKDPSLLLAYKRIIDLSISEGKVILTCHCSPKPCHCDMHQAIIASTLRRMGHMVIETNVHNRGESLELLFGKDAERVKKHVDISKNLIDAFIKERDLRYSKEEAVMLDDRREGLKALALESEEITR